MKLFIRLLLFLLLIAGIVGQTQEPYTVKIENHILKEVIFQDSLSDCLDLSSKKIESIRRRAFKNLAGLKSLDLRNNSISNPPAFIFANLTDLQNLSLADNDINCELDLDKVFVGLNNLTILDLSNNPLYSREGLFSGLSRRVNIFVPGNHLSWISPNFFTSNNNLEIHQGETHLEGLSYFNQANVAAKLCYSKGIITSVEIMRENEKLDMNCTSIEIVSKTLYLNLFRLSVRGFEKGWYRLGKLDLTEIVITESDIQDISENLVNELPREIINLKFDKNQIKRLSSKVISQRTIKRFQLQGNNIEVIENGTFKNTKIQILQLVDNCLHDLEFVKSLPSTMLELSLSSNNIKSVSAGIFSNLPNLRYLHLEENDITHLDNDAFLGLVSLHNLSLSDNRLSQIPSGSFMHLKNLKHLDLGYNHILALPEGIFSNLQNLKHLHIDGNYITNLEDDSFRGLQSLKNLSLSDNRLSRLAPDSLLHLGNLKYLDLSGNDISVVPGGIFSNSMKLEYLRMEENEIISLQNDTFLGLQSLKRLSLSGNRLSQMAPESFIHLKNLKELDLGYNNISFIPEGIFFNHPHLQTLDLGGNDIDSLGNISFFGLQYLGNLDLSYNKLSQVTQESFLPLKNLKNLDLGNNNFSEIPEKIFNYLWELQNLNLEGNFIASLENDTFHGLQSLLTLKLSNNDLAHIAPDSFNHLRNLKDLYLAYNNIHALPEGIFNGVNQLQYLDLSDNEFTEITSQFFSELSISLETLNLKNNKIKYIATGVSAEVPRLQLLLTGNKLSNISSESFNFPNLEVLSLDKNSFQVLNFGSFVGIPHLKILSFRDNDIMEIRRCILNRGNLTYLTHLDISDNPLQRLENGALFGLSESVTVEISNNNIELIQGGVFDDCDP